MKPPLGFYGTPDNGNIKEGKPPAAGSVGEFVPVLEAEVVQEVPSSGTKPPAGKTGAPKRDAMPTLPAEVIDEHKPEQSAVDAAWDKASAGASAAAARPERPTEEARSWHEPPPVRRSLAESSPDNGSPDAGGQVNVFEA